MRGCGVPSGNVPSVYADGSLDANMISWLLENIVCCVRSKCCCGDIVLIVSCSSSVKNSHFAHAFVETSLLVARYLSEGIVRIVCISDAMDMQRTVATLVLLIQFCVQCIPSALADESILLSPDDMLEPPIVQSEITPASSTETDSGSTTLLEALSGAILPFDQEVEFVSASGAMRSSSGVTASGVVFDASMVAPVLVSASSSELSPVTPLRIVISEVMWMGSNVSTADEWVEVAAFSSGAHSAPRSLSGWTLVAVKAGVETTVARLRPEHGVASGGVMILANYHAEASRLAMEPTVVTTGMSLPNTQLMLRLKDASGAIVDEVDDGIGVPFAGANPSGGGSKASMERVNVWGPGNVISSWRTATTSSGFDDGPPIFGTPGALAVLPTSVQPDEPSPAIPTDVPVDVPIIPIQAPPLLRLTEVLPNPLGFDTDEWIEIGSFDTVPIDLAEVHIRTGTTRFALTGQLQSGEYRAFGKVTTGLSLPNVGGTVELLWRDRIIDSWIYGEVPEGISLGRSLDGTVTPQCVPSPNAQTIGAPLNPEIIIQSSNAGAGTLSLNLEARVTEGSLAGASCTWAYPDGYVSSSCNPPSHSMPGPLLGDVILVLKDYCGNTLTRSLHVDVPGKNSDTSKVDQLQACIPTAFTGVVVSEFFPNPDGDEEEGEWIELSNVSTVEKSLCGWSIDDGKRGSDPYPLDRWRLPVGESLFFSRRETGIALNNDVDAVRLSAPGRAGGSDMYEIIRYTGAPEGRSWSRRSDGAWLWAAPTPGTANRFEDVTWPTTIEARIAAALPNPAGADESAGEWIEIENLTNFPLPLTGWTLQTASVVHSLNGVILGPRERKRVSVSNLPSRDAYVRLQDSDSQAQSVLTWKNAKDDEQIMQPVAVSDLSELSWLKSDGCIQWTVKARDGDEKTVRIDSVKSDDEMLCMNYISTLLENKKIDLQKYSNDEYTYSAFLDGTDIASLMLRSGVVILDEESSSPFLKRYQMDEAEARAAWRGIWADESRGQLIDASRRMHVLQAILQDQRLVIKPSIASGVVESGTLLTFTTNVPALLWVAEGTGASFPYNQPIVVTHDSVIRITAVSEVQSSTGSLYSVELFQPYSVLKSRYPMLKISEVYPSPKAGEHEWIELLNPTDEPVSLLGWTIDDALNAGSKPMTFVQHLFLYPDERRVVEVSSIALNNDGDSVHLIDPRGRISDVLTYENTEKGLAVAASLSSDGLKRGQCMTAHPTPGTVNRCAEELKSSKKQSTKIRVITQQSSSRLRRYVNVVEDADEGPYAMRSPFMALLEGSHETGAITGMSFIMLIHMIIIFSLCVGLYQYRKTIH